MINIEAGNREPVGMIDLSNINVQEYEDPNDSNSLISHGEYVFCVTGKYMTEYDLQIARTTNIDFDYELYRVDSRTYGQVITPGISSDPEVNSSIYEVAEYKSEIDGKTYFYPYKIATFDDKTQGNLTPLGSYRNPKDSTSTKTGGNQTIGEGDTAADNDKTFHERNYEDYEDVNIYAEPLYWQIKNLPVTGQVGDAGFVDYYVLKIKWKDKGLINDKETDMIYITARKSIG